MISYSALFFSALVAATLVPMQSEAVLVALMYHIVLAWVCKFLLAYGFQGLNLRGDRGKGGFTDKGYIWVN